MDENDGEGSRSDGDADRTHRDRGEQSDTNDEKPSEEVSEKNVDSDTPQTTSSTQDTADALPSAPATDSSELGDPVKDAYENEIDLYEIATWEPRSAFDIGIIKLVNGIGSRKRSILIALAFSLFFSQLVIAGVFIFEEPILGVLSLLSIVPAFLLVATIWSSDPTSREPISLLGVTFVLAALFASFAAVVNTLMRPGFEIIPILGLPLFFFLIVGPVEEFVKLLAIRVYAFHSDEFRTVVDGAVYGAVAGLGFAAVENLVYIVYFSVTVTPTEIVIEQQEALGIAVTRSFVGPGHVIYSAWAGFYLGLAKFNPENHVPILVKGLLIAAFIHALYNTIVSTVPMTAGGFVLFVIGYLVLWFALLTIKISRYRELYNSRGEHRAQEDGVPTGQQDTQ